MSGRPKNAILERVASASQPAASDEHALAEREGHRAPEPPQGRCVPPMTPPRKKSPLSSSVRRLGADADRDAGNEKVSARAVCKEQQPEKL